MKDEEEWVFIDFAILEEEKNSWFDIFKKLIVQVLSTS